MNIFKRISKTLTALATAVAVLGATAIPTFAAVKHNVTFMYGAKVYTVAVEDGCNATPPTDTYVPGYIFSGWVGNATNVKSDQIILGAYVKVDQPAPTPTPAPQQCKTYEVRFVDSLTGNEYYRQTVSEGADANPPEVPHHDGYHFEQYDGCYFNVDSDRTITALYELDWYWHDDPSEHWWNNYSLDDDVYNPYWWM